MIGNTVQATPPAASRVTAAQRRGVLAVCLMAAFFSPFMGAALNLSISDISQGFNCGATTVTWVVNAFTLTLAVMCVPFGHLADLVSRRRLMLTGLAGFGLTCLLCALSPNILLLIILRVVQGVFAAILFSSNIPLLLAHFPANQRGRMLGLSVTATYTGLSLGPVVGGWLNSAFSWRSIFALAFVLSVAVFVLALRYIAPDRGRAAYDRDLPGNVMYVLMIAFLMLGLSCWTAGWWSKALVLASLPLFYLFARHELGVAQPVVQVRLFTRDAAYTLSNLAALLNYGATFAISYAMSIFLQNVAGLSSGRAGLLLIAQPLVMACVSPAAGRLSDRVAPYKLASLGMLLTSLGLLLLSLLLPKAVLWQLAACLVLIGLGFGLFSSPNTNAVLACVDKSHYGEANSILGTMRTLGQSSSMVCVMFILGSYVGNVVITQAPPEVLTLAISRVMLTGCLVCLAGMGLSLVRGKAKPHHDL